MYSLLLISNLHNSARSAQNNFTKNILRQKVTQKFLRPEICITITITISIKINFQGAICYVLHFTHFYL